MDAAFWGGIRQACDKAEAGGPLFGIDSETYAMWKANSGNAKARRRWRRRNIPNSQQTAAVERERVIVADAFAEDA